MSAANATWLESRWSWQGAWQLGRGQLSRVRVLAGARRGGFAKEKLALVEWVE